MVVDDSQNHDSQMGVPSRKWIDKLFNKIGMCIAGLIIPSMCMPYLWGMGGDGMFVHVPVADQSNQPEHSLVYSAECS